MLFRRDTIVPTSYIITSFSLLSTGKHCFPRQLLRPWGGEFWADGYYVASVGGRGNWDVVEQYIRAQGMKPKEIQLRLL